MLHPALLLGASLLLAGCLTTGEARLPGGTYHLRPPSAAPKTDIWEEVEFQHPKGKDKFLVHILNTAEKTRVTILDPTTMATLVSSTHEAGRLKRTGLIPSREIPDELPIALLQISTWPMDKVRAGLTGHLALEAKPRRRVLLDEGMPIAIIEEEAAGKRTIRLPRHEVLITVRTTVHP